MSKYFLNAQGLLYAKRRANFRILATGLLLIVVGCGTAPGKVINPPPKFDAHIVNETLRITGTGASSELSLRLRAGDPTILEVDVGNDGSADFSFDRAKFDHILVKAGAGDDIIRIDEINGVFTDTEITTLNGGNGDDSLIGGSGAETLNGGPGNDIIDGNKGDDSAFMGAGDDTFIWDPGDGSDVVEGDAGTDVMVFNGAIANEDVDLSANGNRLRFFRNPGNITMDLDSVELVNFNALGGTDNVVVNDLTGTAATHVNVDLASTLGGNTGDALADSVFVNGTANPETFIISAAAGAVIVDGLATQVRVKGFEPEDRVVVNGVGGDLVNVNGSDIADTMQVAPSETFARVTATGFSAAVDVSGALTLAVNGLAGNDTISCSGDLATLGIPLRLDGGEGDDQITGSNGIDTLIGGSGNDIINGKQGNDIAFMGDGDDTFIWNPGDGSDVVEGEGGTDAMVFNGAIANEDVDLSANGTRLRFFRNVATITMDLDGVERIDFNALGGTDNVVVNDLTGTAVTQVNVDLAGTLGGNAGDGLADSVFVNGTVEIDTFDVSADAGAVVVDGLAAQVRVKGFEPEDRVVVDGVLGDVVNVNASAAADTMQVSRFGGFARVTATGFSAAVDVSGPVRLSVNGLAGDDTISASGDLLALGIALVLDGGEGNDVINGGNGNDLLIGGPGNDIIDGNQGSDTAFLGAGDDTFIWDPGDGSDAVEGEEGADVMVFNGAPGDEDIDLSADGPRLRFFRNVGNITMDLDGVEGVGFNALGGKDNVVVNDLTGTAVIRVKIDLAGTLGGIAGDAKADSVTVNGTAAGDAIDISANGGFLIVSGLAPEVRILRSEVANDSLIVNGLGGVDTITPDAGVAAIIMLTINQD